MALIAGYKGRGVKELQVTDLFVSIHSSLAVWRHKGNRLKSPPYQHDRSNRRQRWGDRKNLRDQNLSKPPPLAHVESAWSILLASTSASDTVLPEPSETQLEWFEPPNKELLRILRCFLRPFSYFAMGSVRQHSPPARVELPSLVKF